MHKCFLRRDRENHFRVWIYPYGDFYRVTVQRTCDGMTTTKRSPSVRWVDAEALAHELQEKLEKKK